MRLYLKCKFLVCLFRDGKFTDFHAKRAIENPEMQKCLFLLKCKPVFITNSDNIEKRYSRYGCRVKLLQRLNVKNHWERHENVYVHRAPYWTEIRSTVRDTKQCVLHCTSLMQVHTATLIWLMEKKATFCRSNG